jgi:hypothetical protein
LNCCDFLAQLVSPIIAQKLSQLREQVIDREGEVGVVIVIFFTGCLSDIDILLVVQSKDESVLRLELLAAQLTSQPWQRIRFDSV